MKGPFSFSLVTLLVFSCCSKQEARYSISVGDPLRHKEETLVSAGKKFEFGFFTTGDKGSIYLGIWYYNLLPRTIVWVARDVLLHDSCGGIRIGDDGNVEVECSNGDIIPVTSLERSDTSNRTLKLLDTGNLVLSDGISGTKVWQSFEHPSDTFLPGMKMNDGLVLTSWITPGDPRVGNYTFRQAKGVYIIKKEFAMKEFAVYWTSDDPGFYLKQNLMPNILLQMLSGSGGVSDQKSAQLPSSGKVIPLPNYNGNFTYNNSRLVMNSSGEINFYSLNNSGMWDSLWSAPESQYSPCGKFGICRENEELMCQCPPGYKPASSDDWNSGIFSGGCERVSTCSPNQTFSNILLKNVGGQVSRYDQAKEEEECKEECLNECSCVAYSFKYVTVRGAQNSIPNCFAWTSDLVFQGDGTEGALILSLRVSPSPSGQGNFFLEILHIIQLN